MPPRLTAAGGRAPAAVLRRGPRRQPDSDGESFNFDVVDAEDASDVEVRPESAAATRAPSPSTSVQSIDRLSSRSSKSQATDVWHFFVVESVHGVDKRVCTLCK